MNEVKGNEKQTQQVRDRLCSVLQNNNYINPAVVSSLIFAAALLPHRKGINYNRKYIALNILLDRLENETSVLFHKRN